MPSHIPDSNFLVPASGAGAASVSGPASSTDNAIARYDSTTGKIIQDSDITIDDTNRLTIGSIEIEADSGEVTLVDMPVTATPADGAEQSYSFAIDGINILKLRSEADSAGSIKNKMMMLVQEDTKPTASAYYHGGFLLEPCGAGVADKLYCCMKNSADTYEWVQVAIGS